MSGETLPPPAQHPGWRNAAVHGLTFRSIDATDLPFLARVYASTRTEELAPVPWTEAQKIAFLDMQFRAQHAHYQTNYPKALWLVVERGGDAIGRLYLVRWPRELRLIDIAILPEYRGQGIGTAILRDLFADAAGQRVTIHVEKNNPAMSLYARLGFRPIGEHGVYDLLERRG
ncbi:MAG: family N-acetyltransferase [Xanthobacteraceae bacterium]|nr:family N-acetyltransferase [Xanthobacteraceae bacterium]